MTRLLRFVAIYLLVAGAAALLLLIPLWPWRSSSPQGWALYAILALPIMIAGEWIGDKVLHNRLSRAVDRATRQRQFSWFRIGYLIALTLALIGLALAVTAVSHR
jgi:hypothetical protein